MVSKLTISVGAIILVIAVFMFVRGGITGRAIDSPGEYDSFAQCLTEKGAVMYGAYWCPHCQSQKNAFGSSKGLITYVECDPRGDDGNPNLCAEKGITGYPTWIFADGSKIEGQTSMERLSQKTGCVLP